MNKNTILLCHILHTYQINTILPPTLKASILFESSSEHQQWKWMFFLWSASRSVSYYSCCLCLYLTMWLAPKAILSWKNRFFLFRRTLEYVIITYSGELTLNTILHLHYGLCLQAVVVTIQSNEMRPTFSANTSLCKNWEG